MEQWEALIESCPTPIDLKFFNKAVQTAGVVLKQDLALFEIEWVLQTLLHRPVSLLDTVRAQHTTEQWFKVIGDAFKLLSTICTTLKDPCEPHFEDIVTLCELPLEPRPLRPALACLSAAARACAVGARALPALLRRLETATACRASLATAIGVIVECHPEVAQGCFNHIWRVYLNLLDLDKTNVVAVLQGILGLFTHFGGDLPTAELVPFYERLSSEYVYRCPEVCEKILGSHANIFREQIAKDERLRMLLWEELRDSGKSVNTELVQAITAVYDSVGLCLNKDAMQKIAAKEIIPNIANPRLQVKYTALHILASIERRHNIDMGARQYVDTHGLEFQLRDENVSYDVAEAVSYCIESNLESSGDLLQSAMVFYRHLPASRRKSVVVHGLLNAPADVRTAATIFLISETTAEEECIETHLPFWKDLFDTNDGKDITVVEKSACVFEDFMNHTIFAVDGFLEEDNETIPPKLHRLLELASHVLSFQSKEFTSDLCPVLLSSLIEVTRVSIDATVVKAMRCAVMHIDQPQFMDMLREVCQMLPLESCVDEALVCEVCLLHLQTPAEVLSLDELALALKVVFSRGDVESAVLSEALKKLEALIVSKRECLDRSFIKTIIQRVDGIRFRKNLQGKDDRILNRDILLFLGKYGRETDGDSKNTGSELNLIKLIDTFTLSLPNPNEGVNYKLHLSRPLNVALSHESPEALQKMLVIICAQLASKDDADLQRVLISVCAAVCAAHARGSSGHARAVHAALLYCASPPALQLIATYITEEISPGVRKMLSDGLEAILMQDRDDILVPFVCEHASVLLTSSVSTKQRAGLYITEALLPALKQNNKMSTENLPNILKLVSNTYISRADDVFQLTSEIYMEKIELFHDDNVKSLLQDMLENLMRNCDSKNDLKTDLKVKIFKSITKVVVEFIKKVLEYKTWNEDALFEIVFEVLKKQNCEPLKINFVTSVLKQKYNFNIDTSRNLLTKENCMIMNMFFAGKFCMEADYFCMESALKFLQQYPDVLLEIRYEETLQYIAEFIRNVTPTAVKHERKSIEGCLSAFTSNQVPARLQDAFEEWCAKLPLNLLTTSIEKEQFTDEHKVMIAALKIMLKFFDMATLTDLSIIARKWPKILLKLFSSGYFAYLKPKMMYLTDLLAVSVKFMTAADLKSLLSEGSQLKGLPEQKNGEDFGRFFMSVFFDSFVRRPFVLLEVENCCALINDVVKFSLKRKCTDEQYDNIMELVNLIWPAYAKNSTFKQKHSLLLDLTNYTRKLKRESAPMAWAVNVLTSDGSAEDKARIVAVLPGGDGFSEYYRTFASGLPVRLSEMEGKANMCFRALLDSLVRTRDLTLLDIVMNLAGGDDKKGWWDEALDCCMVSLAANADLPLLKAVYTRAREGLHLGVCTRVLLPLLRFSSSSLCERFYSPILAELLRINNKIPSAKHRYHEYVVIHTKTFKILEIGFLKIPTSSLESITSNVYTDVTPAQGWHMVRETCKLCRFLTINLKLLTGADEKLMEDFRLLQCAIYNCFSAAITCRRPDEDLYDYIFGVNLWDKVTDERKEYKLKIRPLWDQRTKLQPVSIGVEGAGSDLASLSLTHTLRSKMFVRTLSENPLVYDFTKEVAQEEIKNQEVRLPSNELNSHECAATLTALLCHVGATPMTKWRTAVSDALKHGKRNTKWFLAQIICNCKEELKPHAETLSAALLEVVATTPVEREGRKVLNGIHIDILETILHWDAKLEDVTTVNTTIELLLHTLLFHRQHTSLYKTLLTVLDKWLRKFGSMVPEVGFSIFEDFLNDSHTQKTIEILTHLLRAKVEIKQLVPTLLNRLESSQGGQHPAVSELLGLALNVCDNKTSYLSRYFKILDKLRSSAIDKYIKVLCFAQRGCPLCCDELNFSDSRSALEALKSSEACNPLVEATRKKLNTAKRIGKTVKLFWVKAPVGIPGNERADELAKLAAQKLKTKPEYDKCPISFVKRTIRIGTIDEWNRMTMDFARKLLGAEKTKCLQILTSFLSHTCTSSYIRDLFETLDLPELILSENLESFSMVKEGLTAMEGSVKRRLVGLVAGFCTHSVVKLRKAACEVVLVAFEDLLKPPETPQTKKPKTASTHMISCILSNDVYVETVVKAVSMCCLDKDGSINSLARKEMAKHMSKDIGLRFTESFLMTIYVPITANATNRAVDLSVCSSVLLEALFGDLRAQERFRSLKLREEPLQARVTQTGPPKLLSMASTYQGSLTLSSATVGRRRRNVVQGADSNIPEIDVQVTLENILDTFLKFCDSIPEAAETFCIEMLKTIKTQFEFDPCVAQSLVKILERGPNVLTPFVTQICEVFIEDICEVPRIKKSIQDLRNLTRGTSGDDVVKCLQLDVELKCATGDVPMGEPGVSEDAVMQEGLEFTIEDLTAVFGKLSDWDSLTVREKRTIMNSGLPPLWTGAGAFKIQLDNYQNTPSSDWFSRMVTAYKQEGKEYTLKWLREVDRWPRRQFHVSAVTEAIEWLNGSEHRDTYDMCDIHTSDCLAEWAARLMIRHAHNTTIARSTAEEMRARNMERKWCGIANGRGLGSLVLDCVERNVCAGDSEQYLFETETLPWVVEQLTARRSIGRQSGDHEDVRQLLQVAKTAFQECAEVSHADDVLSMQSLILQLHQDINEITAEVTQESLKLIDVYNSEKPEELTNKDHVASICEVALRYYDQTWESDPETSFKEMVCIVSRVRNLGITDVGFLAVVLNRLEHVTGTLSYETAKRLLEVVQLYPTDEFSKTHIRNHRHIFPIRAVNAYPNAWEGDNATLSAHKRYLELVGDAAYSLLQYCDELRAALRSKDIEKWQCTVTRMKEKIFENPHAGSDYQLLNKYKSNLYDIAEFAQTASFLSSAEKCLQDTISQLQRPPQKVLRLSQLCPALSSSRDCSGTLLGLRDTVTVVKFYDQVQVYTDSIRRPVVLKVLTSDGCTRRYILKSGERLQADAAAQYVLAYAGEVWKPLGMSVVGYRVIPLAADSALIEFLEDTERIRDLIKESVDLDGLQSSDLPFVRLRTRTARAALRRAVCRRALSARGARAALRTAHTTLATSTIFTWLLGVGDRHLENILYRQQDGGVCHVDWGQLFEFGLKEPPARLTANLRALGDDTLLEANLQRLLTSLRASSTLFSAVLKMAFKWMGNEFSEKLSHIESLLNGTSRSVDVTRQVIQDSDMPEGDKCRIFGVLEAAFEDYPQNEQYSVEEQISSFLHHCTAPEILSTCRRGWEPWA